MQAYLIALCHSCSLVSARFFKLYVSSCVFLEFKLSIGAYVKIGHVCGVVCVFVCLCVHACVCVWRHLLNISSAN